jgi:hypothetical protein
MPKDAVRIMAQVLAGLAAATLTSCSFTSPYSAALWVVNEPDPHSSNALYCWQNVARASSGSATPICDERGYWPVLSGCAAQLRKNGGPRPSLGAARERLVACMKAQGWERNRVDILE